MTDFSENLTTQMKKLLSSLTYSEDEFEKIRVLPQTNPKDKEIADFINKHDFGCKTTLIMQLVALLQGKEAKYFETLSRTSYWVKGVLFRLTNSRHSESYPIGEISVFDEGDHGFYWENKGVHEGNHLNNKSDGGFEACELVNDDEKASWIDSMEWKEVYEWIRALVSDDLIQEKLDTITDPILQMKAITPLISDESITELKSMIVSRKMRDIHDSNLCDILDDLFDIEITDENLWNRLFMTYENDELKLIDLEGNVYDMDGHQESEFLQPLLEKRGRMNDSSINPLEIIANHCGVLWKILINTDFQLGYLLYANLS